MYTKDAQGNIVQTITQPVDVSSLLDQFATFNDQIQRLKAARQDIVNQLLQVAADVPDAIPPKLLTLLNKLPN